MIALYVCFMCICLISNVCLSTIDEYGRHCAGYCVLVGSFGFRCFQHWILWIHFIIVCLTINYACKMFCKKLFCNVPEGPVSWKYNMYSPVDKVTRKMSMFSDIWAWYGPVYLGPWWSSHRDHGARWERDGQVPSHHLSQLWYGRVRKVLILFVWNIGKGLRDFGMYKIHSDYCLIKHLRTDSLKNSWQ